MKNRSKRTPPLLQGTLALMGLILLALGGFSLWQWVKLRPLRAALDSFTTETPLSFSMSYPPFKVDIQDFSPQARQQLEKLTKSYQFPLIVKAEPSGGWSLSFSAPQGNVSITPSQVVFHGEDGTLLRVEYFFYDKEAFSRVYDEVERLIDQAAAEMEAKHRGLDIS